MLGLYESRPIVFSMVRKIIVQDDVNCNVHVIVDKLVKDYVYVHMYFILRYIRQRYLCIGDKNKILFVLFTLFYIF